MADSVWTIIKTLNWTKQYFESKGIESPRLDAEVLLCAVLGCERITLYVDFARPLTAAELAEFKGYVLRRGRWEPLAYILGYKTFMRNRFRVTPATLIPRPETELLVESLVKAAKLLCPDGAAKILDLGTGSGAIIISLLDYLPRAVGVGADISTEALLVARENAERLKVMDRIGFMRSDCFSRIPVEKKFDIIVANPPYVPTGIIATLAQDVQKEPRLALDGGADGLDFYRRITMDAAAHLAPHGLLAYEVGEGQDSAVEELCLAHGFKHTKVRADYAGIGRMVFALKEAEGETEDENLLLEITR